MVAYEAGLETLYKIFYLCKVFAANWLGRPQRQPYTMGGEGIILPYSFKALAGSGGCREKIFCVHFQPVNGRLFFDNLPQVLVAQAYANTCQTWWISYCFLMMIWWHMYLRHWS